MRRIKPNHWLLDSISQKDYVRALNVADYKLINDSLKKHCDLGKQKKIMKIVLLK